MGSRGASERHGRVVLVSEAADVAQAVAVAPETPDWASGLPASGFSLLRASVLTRLLMAAAAAALLWIAVLWALA